MRIASVLPSATEIACALGAEAELVARSAECDYPAGIRRLPVLMRPRTLDSGRQSAEIDRRVRASRARGESLYAIDLEVLRSTDPDVLVTQDLCGVCSVTGPEVETACREAGVRPKVVSLAPKSLEEVWASIGTLGAAIGRDEQARSLMRSLRASSQPRTGLRDRGGVAVVEWLDPPILAGLWTPEIVETAGGHAVGPKPGEPGRTVSWEELRAAGPRCMVLSPCSFPVERTLAELGTADLGNRLREEFPRTTVVVADEAYFSRPGPRLVHGIELVRHLLDGPETGGSWPMPVVPFLSPEERATA